MRTVLRGLSLSHATIGFFVLLGDHLLAALSQLELPFLHTHPWQEHEHRDQDCRDHHGHHDDS
jgi:hypothetical protein